MLSQKEVLNQRTQLWNRLRRVDGDSQLRSAVEAFRVPGAERANLVDDPAFAAAGLRHVVLDRRGPLHPARGRMAKARLLTDTFADYTGRLAQNPRVTIVNGEGRSFLAQDPTKYDLIYFVAPDSYAAMNAATSGAFVLSESYLYTNEMLHEALRHLADGGLVCMQFGEVNFERKPNRTTRFLGTARVAFHELWPAPDPDHPLVLWASGAGE